MKGNGLVRYYKNKWYAKNGFLDFERMQQFDEFSKFTIFSNVQRILNRSKGRSEWFYVKKPRFEGEIDSEVLLSQVYNKAGINNAVYTPVLLRDFSKQNELSYGVISNSIYNPVKDSCANVFFYDVLQNGKIKLFPHKKPSGEMIIQSFFTEKARKEFVLMHALDIASFNFDRSQYNFFFNNVKEGMVTGISTIDNGFSLFGIKNNNISTSTIEEIEETSKDLYFYNYLGNCKRKTREELVQEIKINETVNEFTSPSEIAQAIGKIDIPKIAKDIKETIDYKVDESAVEIFDRSFTNLAEQLEQQ